MSASIQWRRACAVVLIGTSLPAAGLGAAGAAGEAQVAGWAALSGQATVQAARVRLPELLTAEGSRSQSLWAGWTELRLMPSLRPGQDHLLQVHYVAAALALSPRGQGAGLVSAVPDDRRSLFDLASPIHSGASRYAWHRLDRLSCRYSAGWAALTIGRDAVTVGNGLVFNPMDLFNPFPPTDVFRDYKTGDDMVLLTINPDDWNAYAEWQLLAVPRRSPVTGDVLVEESSFALMAHFSRKDTEYDLLAALHYNEYVVGAGRAATLGQCVWRWDATLTFARGGRCFFSTVSNVDTSWVWKGLNWYGSLEVHYNTIGSGDYGSGVGGKALAERLARGEMHTLGRAYLAPMLQVELHPLLNLHCMAVLNLGDPSAVVLPRLAWSVRQGMELTVGAEIPLGPGSSEFGHQHRQSGVFARLDGYF